MVKTKNKLVENFWLEFCQKSSTDPETSYQVWFFGNSEQMAQELAELVISGKKTGDGQFS